ncbi:mucin-5AC-like isoform X2 [Vespula pensylvanica]|uniref:mucin-5AC-like isoform X2 n=1 Tax=Vespula pensylvanica TaxID=30213 RepID=UPI001CBA384A|nr:mucin-5AC-like isoform X2 [Vespula pensylvanica]
MYSLVANPEVEDDDDSNSHADANKRTSTTGTVVRYDEPHSEENDDSDVSTSSVRIRKKRKGPSAMATEEGMLSGGFGSKLKCPTPISRLRVEKIEGGLMVAGVVIAANCQIALPAFGFLFMLVGAVLTAASYRGPGEDEDKDSYAARIAFTGNSRILGPICIVVGALMLALGILLCMLTRRARRRERRVGFHCPLHGDFYPVSPVQSVKMLGVSGKSASGWPRIPCLKSRTMSKAGANGSHVGPPQCPHSVLSSTRSSVSSSPLSPCPTPMPFLVTSGSVSGMVQSVGANLSPDQTFGSIRSLSVTREVASFPLSRTPTPPPQHRPSLLQSNNDDLVVGVGSPLREASPRPEVRVVAPAHRPPSGLVALQPMTTNNLVSPNMTNLTTTTTTMTTTMMMTTSTTLTSPVTTMTASKTSTLSSSSSSSSSSSATSTITSAKMRTTTTGMTATTNRKSVSILLPEHTSG